MEIVTTREFREDHLGEGIGIPKRFGLTWRDFDRDWMYYHIIPFNIVIAAIRWLYMKLRYYVPDKLDRYWSTQVYQRGYWRGYEDRDKARAPNFERKL
jgi:hypothetical protein